MDAFLTEKCFCGDPRSVSLPLSRLQQAQMDAIIDGTYGGGDPRIGVLDEFLNGTFLRPSGLGPGQVVQQHFYQGTLDGEQVAQHSRRGVAPAEPSFEPGPSSSSNMPLNTVQESPLEAFWDGTKLASIHGEANGGETGSRRTQGASPSSTSFSAADAAAPSLRRKRIDDNLLASESPKNWARRAFFMKVQAKRGIAAGEDSSGLEFPNGVATVHPSSVLGAELVGSVSEKNAGDPSKSRELVPHEALELVSESAEVKGGDRQGKPNQTVGESPPLHLGSGNPLLASPGDNQVNSNCLIALVDTGEPEFNTMALPAYKTWLHKDTQLLGGGCLVVDISPNYCPISVSVQMTLPDSES